MGRIAWREPLDAKKHLSLGVKPKRLQEGDKKELSRKIRDKTKARGTSYQENG